MASDDKEESRYKALVVPEFKSTIPPHVLAKLPSDSERYLVEMMSKMEDRDKWLIAAVVAANQGNIELDQRISKNEKFIDKLTSKWAIFSYLLAAAFPVVLKVLIEKWLKP